MYHSPRPPLKRRSASYGSRRACSTPAPGSEAAARGAACFGAWIFKCRTRTATRGFVRCTYIHTYIHTYTYIVCKHLHACTCVYNTHLRIHIYVIHTCNIQPYTLHVHACVNTLSHTIKCTCIQTYIYIYIYINVCICTCRNSIVHTRVLEGAQGGYMGPRGHERVEGAVGTYEKRRV